MVSLRRDQGKKFVSPGCASDAKGEAWLETWMRLVREKGEGPDYLGLHYYGASAQAAVEYLDKM